MTIRLIDPTTGALEWEGSVEDLLAANSEDEAVAAAVRDLEDTGDPQVVGLYHLVRSPS